MRFEPPCRRPLYFLALMIVAMTGVVSAVPLETRDLELHDGRVLRLEQGTIDVPENRSVDASRAVSIGFMRIPGLPDAAGPPTVMLAGGPGGSYIERIEEGPERQRLLMLTVDLYRQVGDVLFVDLRGVFRSTPNTLCDGAPDKWRRMATEADYRAVVRSSGEACRQKLLDEGFDLAGYVVTEAAADVVAVFDALGIERFNVHGVSFGSHWALTLLKYHGNRVERAVLSGVEGFDDTFDDPAEVRRTVQALSDAAVPAWSETAGYGSPLEALDGLMRAALAGGPEAPALRPHELAVLATSGQGYALGRRSGMAGWPDAVADYATDRVLPIEVLFRNFGARFAGPTGWGGAAVGLFDCASGISAERNARLRATEDPLFQRHAFLFYDAYCEGWNVEELPDEFRASVVIDTPTLMVQGDVDTATPLDNAVRLEPFLANGHLTVVEGGSHGAYWESLDGLEAFEGQVLTWLRGGGPPPAGVKLAPPRFEPVDLGVRLVVWLVLGGLTLIAGVGHLWSWRRRRRVLGGGTV
ncbi:MAG: alpha/beta hydrolase [Pseudomonadota bacterium]